MYGNYKGGGGHNYSREHKVPFTHDALSRYLHSVLKQVNALRLPHRSPVRFTGATNGLLLLCLNKLFKYDCCTLMLEYRLMNN